MNISEHDKLSRKHDSFIYLVSVLAKTIDGDDFQIRFIENELVVEILDLAEEGTIRVEASDIPLILAEHEKFAQSLTKNGAVYCDENKQPKFFIEPLWKALSDVTSEPPTDFVIPVFSPKERTAAQRVIDIARIITVGGDNNTFWLSINSKAPNALSLRVNVNCSDVFFWGSADSEPIATSEDVELLCSLAQQLETSDKNFAWYLSLLYCATKRGMRPQNALLNTIENKMVLELLLVLGVERAVEFGNPKKLIPCK